MQKKGCKFFKAGTITLENMIIHTVMVLLVIGVYLILQSYVNSIENDTEFHKIFLSRDMALLMSTLYAAPANVEYDYSLDSLDISKFNFEFKRSDAREDNPIVSVGSGEIAKIYPYGGMENDNVKYSVKNTKSIQFYKAESAIIIPKNE